MRYALALALLLLAAPASAATWYVKSGGASTTGPADSCENKVGSTHIQDAMDAASSGDTVIIGAGTCTMENRPLHPTSGKYLKVQGAGTMPDKGAATSGGTTLKWTVGAAGGNITSGGSYWNMSESDAGNNELSNITFRLESAANVVQFGLFTQRSSSSTVPVIAHHLTLIQDIPAPNATMPAHMLYTVGMRAVVYRIILQNANVPGAGSANVGPTIACKGAASGVNHHAKNWMATSTMGSADSTGNSNFYIETSTFINTSSAFDIDDGCRAVIRYNLFTDSSVADHGNDTSVVGLRHIELYGNTFECVNEWARSSPYGSRGGTARIFNNIAPATCFSVTINRFFFQIQALRRLVYRVATGYTGTVSLPRTIGSMSSTTNLLAGQIVTGSRLPSGVAKIASVDSATQITIDRDATSAGATTLNASDCYPGPAPWARQQGYGWSGSGTASDGELDPPAFDSFQTIEPVYIWNNTNTSGGTLGEADTYVSSGDPSFSGDNGPCAFDNSSQTSAGYVVENSEYYLSKFATFDGDSNPGGIGSGTRASRPASTTNGLGWWATDQGGDWDTTTGAANDGCLDIVVAGAWVDCSYTPKDYPHTLATETGSSSSSDSGISGSLAPRGRPRWHGPHAKPDRLETP